MTFPTAADNAAVARTLQQGLTPDRLPALAGLRAAGRYRAGGVGDVGGDWYDLLDLGADGVAVVIGDVAGRGIAAATTMAQLRFAVRAFLLDDRAPGSVLSRLNRLVAWLLPGEVATAVVGLIAADHSRVTFASSGHPPVLWLHGDMADYADVTAGPALGLQPDTAYEDAVLPLAPGSGFLLYTDGMVERRGEPIDDGLARLAAAAATVHADTAFVDMLIDEVAPLEGGDDLAVLAVVRDS